MCFIPDSAVNDVTSAIRKQCFVNQLCCGTPLFNAVRSSHSIAFLGLWPKLTQARTEAKKQANPPANEATPATMVAFSLNPLKVIDTAIASKQSNPARMMSVMNTLADRPNYNA